MQNHEFKLSKPNDFLLKFSNNCIDKNYYYCNKCGFQRLSVLEEVISGYTKVYIDYYFLNDKLVDFDEFNDLTCNEVMVKMLVE